MKKDFSIIHNIIIFSLISTLALTLVIVVNLVTKPIVDERLLRLKLETYEMILKDIDDIEVLESNKNLEVIKALDKDKDVMGIIYITTSSNGYGDIKMISLVSTSGVIENVMFLEYTQTEDFKPVSSQNIKGYIGLNVSQISTRIDFSSGATQSLDSIKESMAQISEFHQTLTFEVSSPFSIGVDGFFEIVSDQTFSQSQTVIEKRNILNASGNDIAYIYTLKKAGPYYEDSEDAEISIHVVLDLNNTILNIVIFDDEYKHSKGAFYTRIKSYVAGFTGKSLTEDAMYVPDWNTGATSGNSKALIDAMLLDLVEVLR
jgi:Na+-translocating ferredoxin:NAD+ oxidoreductase RnfG subunit